MSVFFLAGDRGPDPGLQNDAPAVEIAFDRPPKYRFRSGAPLRNSSQRVYRMTTEMNTEKKTITGRDILRGVGKRLTILDSIIH